MIDTGWLKNFLDKKNSQGVSRTPPTLKTLDVENWKSLKRVHLEFDAINVLIGPNGSGKSNIVQFFHMLNMMMTGSLQLFVGQAAQAHFFITARSNPHRSRAL